MRMCMWLMQFLSFNLSFLLDQISDLIEDHFKIPVLLSITRTELNFPVKMEIILFS